MKRIPTPTPGYCVNTQFAIFFTICLLSIGAARSESSTPDIDTIHPPKEIAPESRATQTPRPLPQNSDPRFSNPPAPQEKPISKQYKEEGEEHSYSVESTYRSQYIYPSNYGTAGIFRVRSAESLPDGALTFGIGGEFYTTSDLPLEITNGYGPGSANTIAENIFIGYAPTPHLTLAAMRRNSSTTFGTPQQLISSLGDFNFSAMYSFPITESFALAPIGNFLIASNFNDLAPAGSTISAGAGVAGTFSLYPSLEAPVFLHANLFYHLPQLRTTKTGPIDPETFFSFSRYHTVMWGVGAEYKMGDFIPFLEFTDVAHTNSTLGFGQSPSKVSLGARFTPLENKGLAFLAGTDIGLSRSLVSGVPFNPAWQIIGQLSYTFGLTTTERKHYYTTRDVNIVDRKFVIKKIIKFKVGKAELEPESTSLLNQIADVIRENKIKKLLIAGHTDSSHGEEYNLKLSIDRANTVKTYLISRGIAEEILTTQGFGKRRPKASNAKESGREINRRVEFFIIE